MAIGRGILKSDGQAGQIGLASLPDTCPNCLCAAAPIETGTGYLQNTHTAELVFRCPRLQCSKFFIGRYQKTSEGTYAFQGAVPKTLAKTKQNDSVNAISPAFCKIFGEAELAEGQGLMEIAGVGYRKALEFLIKDYLLAQNDDATYQAQTKAKFLGRCISEDVANENIKQVAKRAVWLGNDETHYVRIWEGKDLQDLKKLIRITTDWIELEQLTQEIQTDMPTA
jgi:hypothetical protein